MLRHQSIATIDNPEFINLQPLDVSPLISSCDVKVLYLGENRNRTFINKTTATEMAKTLRGCPIVGYYKKDKEDFGDHGHRVIFDDDGIKFECLTVPFGFISPDAPVWFQKFTETNPMGEEVEREYLMTKGLLWTGQFEEAKKVLENGGKGQSMELGDDMQGEWFTKENGVDLFIISDAIFSKLCILGDDVEPCFEGASITQSYSLMDKDFTATLYTMMSELKEVLGKGGQDNMVKEPETKFTEEASVETTVDTQATQETTAEFTEEPAAEGEAAAAEPADEGLDTTEDAGSAEFKQNEEEKDAEDKKDDTAEDDDEKDKKYQLLESEYTALQEKYDTMKAEFDTLVAYKKEVEDGKKDKLIESFYFLSDEDKKDVIENKSNYTYDEIEAKLSVLAVRNKVDFSLGTDKEEEKSVPATYTLGDMSGAEDIPAWAKFASSFK